MRSIEFDTMQDICKKRTDDDKCTDDDNLSFECCSCECPIWNDLLTDEIEL